MIVHPGRFYEIYWGNSQDSLDSCSTRTEVSEGNPSLEDTWMNPLEPNKDEKMKPPPNPAKNQIPSQKQRGTIPTKNVESLPNRIPCGGYPHQIFSVTASPGHNPLRMINHIGF